ncbi:hypothetical protein JKI59_004409, partial [Salmonella enterica]|nr:hypothetical protein [Salmonella enterica]
SGGRRPTTPSGRLSPGNVAGANLREPQGRGDPWPPMNHRRRQQSERQ